MLCASGSADLRVLRIFGWPCISLPRIRYALAQIPHMFFPVSLSNDTLLTLRLTFSQRLGTAIPGEIAMEIFLCTHSCERHDPDTLKSMVLVCKDWKNLLYSLPLLWHHILLSPRHVSQALAHIPRTRNQPLHLTFEVDTDNDDISNSLSILVPFADRWQQIEIDCQLGYCWHALLSMPILRFLLLQKLKMDGIPWDTLNKMLRVLVAPALQTLEITLDLDYPTAMINLAKAEAVTCHMPALTHLAISTRRLSDSNYVGALMFMYGWTFVTITHFTTNIPIFYLSALHLGNTRLSQPGFQYRHGFPQPFPMPSIAPCIAFPRLRHLTCSDTNPRESLEILVRIPHVRMVTGLGLETLTCRADLLSFYDVARLERYVPVYQYDVTDEEYVL